MLVGEITDDGIGFPQRETVGFFQSRHQRVGVHRQIGRLLGLAEGAADIDAGVFERQFAYAPHCLLDIGRRVAAPDFDHLRFLPNIFV
jgi:hypothetical protein